jgi:hypothetical protein
MLDHVSYHVSNPVDAPSFSISDVSAFDHFCVSRTHHRGLEQVEHPLLTRTTRVTHYVCRALYYSDLD